MDKSKDYIVLTQDELVINDIINLVVSPNCGAISSFIGTTRNIFDQKNVIKLEYEAYEPMALKEMFFICSGVRKKWDVEKIAIYHRLGEVPVGEASVVIVVSSTHRKESLQAVQYVIDELKANVPIWKKEIYDTNETTWKQNSECDWKSKKEF